MYDVRWQCFATVTDDSMTRKLPYNVPVLTGVCLLAGSVVMAIAY